MMPEAYDSPITPIEEAPYLKIELDAFELGEFKRILQESSFRMEVLANKKAENDGAERAIQDVLKIMDGLIVSPEKDPGDEIWNTAIRYAKAKISKLKATSR